MMFKLKYIFYGILFLVVVIWGHMQYEYWRIERLTSSYGQEFNQATTKGAKRRSGKVEYLKVFEYASDKAKIFYVSVDRSGNRIGRHMLLEKNSTHWEVTDEWILWASYGSADDWTWPPYK